MEWRPTVGPGEEGRGGSCRDVGQPRAQGEGFCDE